MKQIKCITFDKAAQDNLPQEIKDKMKADREKASEKMEAQLLCNTVRHRMMKSGIYKECPNCGEKFKEDE